MNSIFPLHTDLKNIMFSPTLTPESILSTNDTLPQITSTLLSHRTINLLISTHGQLKFNPLGIFTNFTRALSYLISCQSISKVPIQSSNELPLVDLLPDSYKSSYLSLFHRTRHSNVSVHSHGISLYLSRNAQITIFVSDADNSAVHSYTLHYAILYSIAFVTNSIRSPVPEPPHPTLSVSHHANFIISSFAYAMCIPPFWNAQFTSLIFKSPFTFPHTTFTDIILNYNQTKFTHVIIPTLLAKLNPFHNLHSHNQFQFTPYELILTGHDKCILSERFPTDVLTYHLHFDTSSFINLLYEQNKMYHDHLSPDKHHDKSRNTLIIPPLPKEIFELIVLYYLLIVPKSRNDSHTPILDTNSTKRECYYSSLSLGRTIPHHSLTLTATLIVLVSRPAASFESNNFSKTVANTDWPLNANLLPLAYTPRLRSVSHPDTPSYYKTLPPRPSHLSTDYSLYHAIS